MSRVVLPGATIGVLGSGQLGRMMAIAARRMGYRIHTFSPGEDTPTGQVADLEITADYEDLEAIRAFAQGVQVITFEFENVSTEAAAAAAVATCWSAAGAATRSGARPVATPAAARSSAPARSSGAEPAAARAAVLAPGSAIPGPHPPHVREGCGGH